MRLPPSRGAIKRREVLHGAVAIALTTALSVPAFARERSRLVSTRAGSLRGVHLDGVHCFKGIPYGADTRGRRFRAPLPAPPWREVRDATEYGPACPQRAPSGHVSEDCLRLNVWTPSVDARAKRPVLVYVHGGEFSSGSGSSPLYDGTRLCQRGDVVVVTVNHRLNLFGHLYLARLGGREFVQSGNVGLLDLILALEWVRDNVQQFGGDPKCVTIFGQSGGGAKIATLMAMPAARGLFHRALTMSGQQITAAGPRSSTLRARACMQYLRMDVDALLVARTEQLVEALEARDPTLYQRAVYFGPVLDHEVLLRHPFYPDAPNQSSGIPMIIGNTRDETRAFHGNDPGIESLDWPQLPDRLLDALHVDIDPRYVIEKYRALYPKYSPTEVLFAATTAARSWRGALIELELRARQGAPTYAYQLNYRSPLEGGRYGAMHTMDIPLIFDNISQPESLTGTTPEAQRTADAMSDALIAFARTGNPNHAGIPDWKPYALPDRPTMIFDAQSSLVHDPRGEERKLFEAVPYVQRGTY